MLTSVALICTCLLSLTMANPIGQRDVLDQLVTQRNLAVVRDSGQQQVNTLDALVSELPQLMPTLLPNVSPSTGAKSSSESESSEQSESSEDSSEEPPDSDVDTSEQTSEQQDNTSEDTTSEETPSPLQMQLLEHTDPDGDLRDDSRGSEENLRRLPQSWIRAIRHHIHHPVGGVGGGGVTSVVPVTQSGTVGGVNAATPVPEPNSDANESPESQEGAELQLQNMCREITDSDCLTYSHSDDNLGPQWEEHRGQLII